jgi:hypothetical protein
MGRLFSTLGLAIVLAGLVGYIYFVDSGRPDPGVETKEKVFGELTGDDIETVTIKSADGETTTVRKTNGTWALTAPVATEADQTELSNIASSTASLEMQRVVDEAATDVKQYGLDPARIEVTFTSKGGQPRRVLLGEKTPTGSEVYAKLPEQPRVFLVSSFLESTFNKNTFALRDKTVLKFDREKVDGFTIASGPTTLQFAKAGSTWSIVKPFAARADYGAVEGAVERLGSIQMQSIAADAADDLKKYGLDAPNATFTVTAGSAKAVLTLGSTENAVVFAKDAARPLVFTVAPTLRTDVIKPVGDFRRKDLFDFRSFSATRVTFTQGSETRTFDKTKTKDDKGQEKDVWKSGGKDIDAAKAEDLLTKVSNLRAQSFEEARHPSLATPALTVVAVFEGSTPSGAPQDTTAGSSGGTETVTIARAGADVYASRTGEPGAAKLEPMAFDEIIKALDATK